MIFPRVTCKKIGDRWFVWYSNILKNHYLQGPVAVRNAFEVADMLRATRVDLDIAGERESVR